MFCPVCSAEYRPGITTCSDCQVGLVSSLPATDQANTAAVHKGPLVPLLEGEDLALHASLLEALDAEKIPYLNKPLSVYPGVRRADPFPVQPLTRFGYKVAVFDSDYLAAKRILEKLFGERPPDLELPAQEVAPSQASPLAVPTELHPAVEVWSGSDDELARFLTAALQENEIPSHLETFAGQKRLSVCAANTESGLKSSARSPKARRHNE